MAYFDCQIVQGGGGMILTVTCNSVFAGAAITATDGETTLQATCPSSSPYEVQFNIPNAGTWTISGTYSGDTYTTQIIIPSSAILSPIPNGSTASPTDVIQTWLHCANIWNKTYTTISQVLNDATTVTALIASNNAADYMARSTTWASSVCANSSAMTKIGANNYCADALLGDSTWASAIANSTYFERVLNVKVPTMTSNTTPSGEVIYSSQNSTSTWAAYHAFDGNNTTYWVPAGGTGTDAYIGYKFTSEVKVIKWTLTKWASDQANSVSFILQGSNNNSNWNSIGTAHQVDFTAGTGQNIPVSFSATNNTKYLYYRIKVTSGEIHTPNVNSSKFGLQFYGRA